MIGTRTTRAALAASAVASAASVPSMDLSDVVPEEAWEDSVTASALSEDSVSAVDLEVSALASDMDLATASAASKLAVMAADIDATTDKTAKR